MRLEKIESLNNISSIIPSQKAFEENVLPIKVEDGYLHVAMTDKNNLRVINDLAFQTGLKIEVIELPPDVILSRLKEMYSSNTLLKNNLVDSISDSSVNESSNVDFVNQVISNAIKIDASDIHFESLEHIYRIRYRVDGRLREVFNLPKSRCLSIASRLKIMASLDISEKRRPQDGKISFGYLGNTVDIRVSTLPTGFGEKIVLRILNRSSVQLDITKLGLTQNQLDLFQKKLKLPYGMILVTGPTGSGKTTSLYAALKSIHSVEKNIMTIEDPIEYYLEGVNQSHVKPEIGFDFASALRSFLRQDPDVIMVGEIRDRETAEIAIRSSLTGHLVFSTLHTNDSISAVSRLVDMGIEPYLVASSVKLIIAQRLVRKLCDCKVAASQIDNELYYQPFIPKGCPVCSFSGFKGRTAIFEFFEITDEIAELISKKAALNQIKLLAVKKDFSSLKDSGFEKINLGLTTYDEVLRETML